jgi:hypothetical protein
MTVPRQSPAFPDPRTGDRLYALLPAVHRSRDEELGSPLRALLRVVEEQLLVLEDDLDARYANWFVETCDEWVLPYLGELVGVPATATPSRAAVADAVRDRRRKGTAAALEGLAADVAGWPARAVETYRLLVRHQHIRHLLLERKATADLRDTVACDRIGGPFDQAPRLVDVRRIDSAQTRGRPNIPSLALHVWRLLAFPVRNATAFCIDRRDSHYLVNVLGNDTQLFQAQDVPRPLRRVELEAAVHEFYGPDRGLMIWRDQPDNPVPADQIVAADLTDWVYRPQPGQVAVDPESGRIAFPPEEAPEEGVWVSWCYGFSDRTGGGPYPRKIAPVGDRRRYAVGPAGFRSITAALEQWYADKAAGRPARHALIEIEDSADYSEALSIELEVDDRLELRAAPGERPVIRLLNQKANRLDALRVRAGTPPPGTVADCPPPEARRPRLVLDGLVVSGRSIVVTGEVGELVVRHCTLVPGWELEWNCRPSHGEESSIELRRTTARLRVERSIVGTIMVDQDEVATEPLVVDVLDSILDSTSPELAALTAPENRPAYVELTLRRSTVFGELAAYLLRLGEDSIVTGCLTVARRDTGCLRYSYAPPGGPARHRCQPDLVIAAAAPADQELAARRVRPRFSSVRYGRPDYAQLHPTCADGIRTGAEDGSEMGAFSSLHQPQRLAALTDQLASFVPVGVDAGVIPAT